MTGRPNGSRPTNGQNGGHNGANGYTNGYTNGRMWSFEDLDSDDGVIPSSNASRSQQQPGLTSLAGPSNIAPPARQPPLGFNPAQYTLGSSPASAQPSGTPIPQDPAYGQRIIDDHVATMRPPPRSVPTSRARRASAHRRDNQRTAYHPYDTRRRPAHDSRRDASQLEAVACMPQPGYTPQVGESSRPYRFVSSNEIPDFTSSAPGFLVQLGQRPQAQSGFEAAGYGIIQGLGGGPGPAFLNTAMPGQSGMSMSHQSNTPTGYQFFGSAPNIQPGYPSTFAQTPTSHPNMAPAYTPSPGYYSPYATPSAPPVHSSSSSLPAGQPPADAASSGHSAESGEESGGSAYVEDPELGHVPDDIAGEEGRGNIDARFVRSIEYHHDPSTQIFQDLARSKRPEIAKQPERPIVSSYSEYHAEVLLYEIVPEVTGCHWAQAWLDNITHGCLLTSSTAMPPAYPIPVISTRFVHHTRGFISEGTSLSLLVLHNATNPFPSSTESTELGTTTIGTYGFHWFEHDWIHWITFTPCQRAWLNLMVSLGHLRLVRTWGKEMPASERRFHKAYWIAANGAPLSTLLRQKEVENPEDPEKVEDEDDQGDWWVNLDGDCGPVSAADERDAWDLVMGVAERVGSQTLDHTVIGDPDKSPYAENERQN
ncbi:hypothetical protein BU23DRAFT_235960 [Bimuria novae-zelandiae CBS 107.79]|uniref:Uncharacterized protein n=1 Tax=Bimuria novae-zelandiae CBS 107.79 TaxID=1447943 RepID=A0A6A5UYI1_9PLEO|nr:hypothetical protein BU23DRAFT_235960 [Bimuria novae-zelandiae CBS 107.79]